MLIFCDDDDGDDDGDDDDEWKSNASIVQSFNASYGVELANWNLAWDHACNLIVSAPLGAPDKSVVFESWMISEYDGQARQQHDFAVQPVPLSSSSSSSSTSSSSASSPWVKVPGLGALDGYGDNTGGPWQWNCGKNCSLYMLEQQRSSQSPTQTSTRIIGRNFHTGEVLSNISNDLRIRTLTAPSELWYLVSYDMHCFLYLVGCHTRITAPNFVLMIWCARVMCCVLCVSLTTTMPSS